MSARDPLHDDLDAAESEAWRLLEHAVADRRAPMHTPTVATIGLDGRPRLRTVVLRAADRGARTLRFHTDRRSDKVAEIERRRDVALLGYDPAAKVQLRVAALARLHLADAVADQAWDQSQRMSRACYATMPAPGAMIEAGGAFTLPTDPEAVASGRVNFVAVVLTVLEVEWLHLAHEGHRRARFDAAGKRWLVP